MASWPAQSFQAVWFTPGPIPLTADAGYTAATKTAPASTQNVAATLTSIAAGVQGQSSLQFQTQLGRADLYELPVATGPSLPVFSNLNTSMRSFLLKVEQISAQVGDANRVALLVTICKEAATVSDATNLVLSSIATKLPFTDGTDFFFKSIVANNYPR